MVQANLATTYREKSAVLMKEVPEGDTEEAKDARDYAGDSLEVLWYIRASVCIFCRRGYFCIQKKYVNSMYYTTMENNSTNVKILKVDWSR